jgi:hypothetical protein
LNLISLPVYDPALGTAAELLADICTGEADSLWWYDCESRSFWSHTILDTGDGWDTWTGMPFWVNIYSAKSCPWIVSGPYDTGISFSLCPGLNMVSLPLYTTSITRASELMADVPNCTAVFRWKREISCYNKQGFDAFFDISDPAEDFSLHSGYGYWVNVTAAGTWVPPNP